MIRRNYIQEAWNTYRREVLPPDAHRTHINETRRAFYGGAALLFHLLLKGVSSEDRVSSTEMTMMADMQKELEQFGQMVMEGRA